MQTNKAKASLLLITGMILAAPAFAESGKIDLGGDLRYRHEMVSQEGQTPGTQHRHKLRFRLHGQTEVNSFTDVGFRLATGTGGNSTNHTMGSTSSGYNNWDINVDRAFFHMHPADFFNLYGGRLMNPFYLPGGTDLVWDQDLNFDGLAFRLNHAFSNQFEVFYNQGFFWVSQGSATVADNHQISPQVGFKANVGGFRFGLAGAYHHYTHMVNQTVPAPGNNTATSSAFTRNFRIWDLGFDAGTDIMNVPFTVLGNYVSNSGASEEKTGFLAGLKIGKVQEAGDFAFGYDYRRLKRDAVVSAFTESDVAGGGTNIRAHRVKLDYQMAKSFTTSLAYMMGKENLATGQTAQDRNTLQLDLSYNF